MRPLLTPQSRLAVRVSCPLRRSATPEGADAELLVLLAQYRSLPLERRADRIEARQRLATSDE
jgi:hypothetical protein